MDSTQTPPQQPTQTPPHDQQKTEPKIVKEVHHHHYKHSAGPGSIFFEFIVVVIGLFFLARNAGWVPDNFAFDWNWIWPLIIIFVGVSILSKNGWVSWLIGGIVTLVVLGVLAMMIFGGWNTPANETTDAISIDKHATATTADVSIKTGAGDVTISGGSEKLVNGSFTHTGLTLEQEDTTIDGKQQVSFETTGKWTSWGKHRNDLNLKLSDSLPLALTLGTGATNMKIDLSTVMATDVTIDTGASDLSLTLGDKADLANVSVDAGASSITITLPKTVGAKIDIDSGATSKTLPDFTKRDDKTYESTNYSSATKKILFDFNLGAANLTFNWK